MACHICKMEIKTVWNAVLKMRGKAVHDELRSEKMPDHVRTAGHGNGIEHKSKSEKFILRFVLLTKAYMPDTVKSNELKCPSLEQRKFILGTSKENGWLMLKKPELHNGLGEKYL